MIDLGKFYTSLGADPALTGTIFSPPPDDGGAATDTATATTTPTSIAFPGTATTPAGRMSLLLIDPTSPTPGGGDFFRVVSSPLPPSPATLSAITLPAVSLTKEQLQAMIDAQLPLSFALGGRAFVETVTIEKFSLASVPPDLAFTALGSVASSSFGNRTSSISFSFSGTLPIRPSHDSVALTRVLAVPVTSPKLTVFGVQPDFLVDWLAGPLADTIGTRLEASFNGALNDAVASGLAATGEMLAPGAVVSAQRAVVGGDGMTIGLVLARLNGAVTQPLPIEIRVDVSPNPMGRSGVPTQYTVTVRDTAGNAVDGASVRLSNVDAHRNPDDQHGVTHSGQWQTRPDTRLHELVVPHLGRDVPPSVTVGPGPSSPSFAQVTVELDLMP